MYTSFTQNWVNTNSKSLQEQKVELGKNMAYRQCEALATKTSSKLRQYGISKPEKKKKKQ